MTRVRAFLAVLIGALLLLSVTAVAGRPNVFSDTDDYYLEGRGIVRGVDGLLHGRLFFDPSKAGERLNGQSAQEEPDHNQDGARSAYYGAFLYALEQVGTLWLVAAVQAALAAWLLFTVWRVAAPGAPLWSYAALMGGLAVGSSLPFFTAFAMPDVFAGFAALALTALFFYRDRLSRAEQAALWALLAACINFHSSNLLTVAGLAVAAAAILAVARTPWRAIAGRCAMVAAAIAVAMMASHLFAFAVKLKTGDDLRRPPFLMARVLADGPGRRYLQVACDRGDKLALCRFRHNPLTNEEDILWDDDPTIGIFNSSEFGLREQLEKEEMRFVLGAVAYDFPAQVAASLKNWAVQLGEFNLMEPLKDPVYYLTDPYWRTTTLRPVILHMGWCAPLDQGCRPRLAAGIVEPWQLAVLFVSLGFVGWRLVRREVAAAIGRRAWSEDAVRLAASVALLLFAVVLNAGVCGVLSGPFPRYQARLIWLIPVAAGLAAACLSPALRGWPRALKARWSEASSSTLGQAARAESGSFLRFALVGAGGFLFDGLVLKLGLLAGLTPAAARLISISAAMQFTFLVNGLVTFGGFDRRRLPRQWIGYMAANSVGAICNYALFVALVASRLPLVSQHFVALAMGSGFGLGLNYTGTRLLAFRRAPR